MTTTSTGQPRRGSKGLLRAVPAVAAAAALALTACAPEEESAEFDDAQPAGQTEEAVETAADENDGAADSDGDDSAAQESGDDSETTAADDSGQDGADETATGSGETAQSDADVTPDSEEVEYTVTMPTYEPGMGEVTVGVYPLEVEEDVMRLRLAVTPDLDGESSIRTDQMFDTVGPGRLMLPTLNDRVNLKEYSILGASGMTDDGWSTGSQEIGDAETGYYWAYYAAPEDDIDSISVAVAQGMPEFDDVPIDWGQASPGDSDSEGNE